MTNPWEDKRGKEPPPKITMAENRVRLAVGGGTPETVTEPGDARDAMQPA